MAPMAPLSRQQKRKHLLRRLHRLLDALAATENSDGSGFQVLLQGTGNKAGSFYVWSTDANGVIQKAPAGNPLHKRLTSAGSSCSPPISIKIPLPTPPVLPRAKDSHSLSLEPKPVINSMAPMAPLSSSTKKATPTPTPPPPPGML